MDLLKTFFPFSFTAKKDVVALVVNVIIYLLVGAVAGIAIAILSKLPIIGFIIGLLGGLVDLYVFIGIVLALGWLLVRYFLLP